MPSCLVRMISNKCIDNEYIFVIFSCVFAIHDARLADLFLPVPFWRVTRLGRRSLYSGTPPFLPLPELLTFCSLPCPAGAAARQKPSLCNPFRINTCKSLSKQTTSTPIRTIDLQKNWRGEALWLTNWHLGVVSKNAASILAKFTPQPSVPLQPTPPGATMASGRRKSSLPPGNNSAPPGV